MQNIFCKKKRYFAKQFLDVYCLSNNKLKTFYRWTNNAPLSYDLWSKAENPEIYPENEPQLVNNPDDPKYCVAGPCSTSFGLCIDNPSSYFNGLDRDNPTSASQEKSSIYIHTNWVGMKWGGSCGLRKLFQIIFLSESNPLAAR